MGLVMGNCAYVQVSQRGVADRSSTGGSFSTGRANARFLRVFDWKVCRRSSRECSVCNVETVHE